MDDEEFTNKMEIGFGSTKRRVRAQWGSASGGLAFLRHDASEAMIDAGDEDHLKVALAFLGSIPKLYRHTGKNLW